MLSAVQHSGDRDDENDLDEGIGPEFVRLRQVFDQEDAVDVQHECGKRLLSERDENDPEWTGHRPAPCQQRVPDWQRHGEIQETPDSQIGEREIVRVQIREQLW